MLNAAVMGLVGRLRYVLLTDALLESLPRRQVQAVMAHEIGHVRHHHMPWLIASLFATICATSLIFGVVVFVLASSNALLGTSAQVELLGSVVAVVVLFVVFGWVSRRFERQADTFAVKHLSQYPLVADGESELEIDAGACQPTCPTITVESVQTMQQTLHTIAHLQAVPLKRHSWRHGSIAFRSNYLASLIGRDVSALSIDRHVKWIKLIAAIALGLTVAYLLLVG